jgi:hypothetical protein
MEIKILFLTAWFIIGHLVYIYVCTKDYKKETLKEMYPTLEVVIFVSLFGPLTLIFIERW